MLLPNQTCILVKSAGNNLYGQPLPGVRSKERCSIVKMPTTDVKSSVRSDSSASRGEAREAETDAVVLLTKGTKAKMHDLLVVRGTMLKITAVEPRWNAAGALDHFEANASIWTE